MQLKDRALPFFSDKDDEDLAFLQECFTWKEGMHYMQDGLVGMRLDWEHSSDNTFLCVVEYFVVSGKYIGPRSRRFAYLFEEVMFMVVAWKLSR